MYYIKIIAVFLFGYLVVSCSNNEKDIANNTIAEKIELKNEVSNPVIEAFIDRMIREEHFKGVVMAVANN